MLRNKSTTPPPPPSSGSQHIDSLIGAHARFKGELAFEGTVRIDGKFEGNIRSSKDGTLIVSETAEIIGDANVPNIILHGTIRGNVRASRSLQVGPKGRLNGDLEYTVLSLSEGAAVNGRCSRIEDRERMSTQTGMEKASTITGEKAGKPA